MNFDTKRLTKMAKDLYQEERNITRLDNWFLAQELKMKNESKYNGLSNIEKKAAELYDVIENLELIVSKNNIFVGTQRDAFAMSYALINPTFTVESFSGYCDPTGVFNDIEVNDVYTKDRIEKVRSWFGNTQYAKSLSEVYKEKNEYTEEVAFFFEQVTGHTIADFELALDKGLLYIKEEVDKKLENASLSTKQKETYRAINKTLDGAILLSERYKNKLVSLLNEEIDEVRKEQLNLMIATLDRVPSYGARNLFEAIQSYLLLWQVMCLEQLPNPFAFSVGNCDRIFLKYYEKDKYDRETISSLFKHFLVFFNIGTRSWAISQNILISGKDVKGNDLTNELSYALLDAYYDMNLPQPILSVKLHKNTPNKLYEELGKFFFTPGCLTPSLFNDDSLFVTLKKHGVNEEDLPCYAVAGCQEPLIKGKDNGNTTSSWLNLGKILELTLNNGFSTLTNKKMGPSLKELGLDIKDTKELLERVREAFYKNLDFYLDQMCDAANKAAKSLSLLPVPFLSCFMGGLDSGYDMRDSENQGTIYNGNGTLVHGLSVLADSFIAIDEFLKQDKYSSDDLLNALKDNFNNKELHNLLKSYPKFGNNNEIVDNEAKNIAKIVSSKIRDHKNYLGNSFKPDFATPSTHLLYGYHVGATPDGRIAREMLGYGVDPLYGEATNGLGFRMLSLYKLPFEEFNGGYASHLGVDPKYFVGDTYEKKGLEFKEKIIDTVFFASDLDVAPSYLYVNVTTAETLRKVLADPKKYAPNGVYIMRIHGTFVNFLDLSPAIQDDIIKRLDNNSSRLS